MNVLAFFLGHLPSLTPSVIETQKVMRGLMVYPVPTLQLSADNSDGKSWVFLAQDAWNCFLWPQGPCMGVSQPQRGLAGDLRPMRPQMLLGVHSP
jgi:hypothetical protein